MRFPTATLLVAWISFVLIGQPSYGLAQEEAFKALDLSVRSLSSSDVESLGRYDHVRPVGAWILSSANPSFGGVSGIEISPDGNRLDLVTDRGRWISADVVSMHTENGLQLENWRHRQTIKDISRADGEALVHAEGQMVVALEVQQKLLTFEYPSLSQGKNLEFPGDFVSRDVNFGIEALSEFDDALLVFRETRADEQAHVQMLVRHPELEDRLVALQSRPGFSVTGADRLGLSLYTLERSFGLLAGFAAEIREHDLAALNHNEDDPLPSKRIARFSGGSAFDNFEGLAVHQDAQGQTHMLMISDDNFHALQRTLLIHLVVLDGHGQTRN